MALLAESLVEEWLNRQGFFTIRGVRSGVDEIDLLAVKSTPAGIEAWHVEVQVSVNPISYISHLTKEQTDQYKIGKTSAKRRSPEVLEVSVGAWIDKKYKSEVKSKARESLWPGLKWSFYFVHGKIAHPEELGLIKDDGEIELLEFHSILKQLVAKNRGGLKGGAGSDIADMIGYYHEFLEKEEG